MRLGDGFRVDGVDADLVDLLHVQHEVALLLEHLAALAAPQRLRPRRLRRANLLSLPLPLDGSGRGGIALLGEVDGRLRLREEVAKLVHVHRRELAWLGGRARLACGGELGLRYGCLGKYNSLGDSQR